MLPKSQGSTCDKNLFGPPVLPEGPLNSFFPLSVRLLLHFLRIDSLLFSDFYVKLGLEVTEPFFEKNLMLKIG